MRTAVMVIMITVALFSARIDEKKWPKDRTFEQYLAEHNLSHLMTTITAEDMQYVREIQQGERYYELYDHGTLKQALIPVNEAMEIQIVRQDPDGYRFDIVPITAETIDDGVSLTVAEGWHQQIAQQTGHPRLNFFLKKLYQGSLDFRSLRPGDRIAFYYSQKARLGRPLGAPKIHAALIQTNGKSYFRYVGKHGEIYRGVNRSVVYTATEKRPHTYTTTQKIPTEKFRMPLDHPRITSRFSLRRWHPILKKYRPHHGVDFGAKRGTPLRAVLKGKVVYAGWMRGYGKVVKIDHGAGFVSLYAHQSKILVKLRQYVKRGQVIGHVGSTGRSTGPHLHFGLYLNGKPVDPLKYIARRGIGRTRTVTKTHTVMKSYSVRKRRLVPIKRAKEYKRKLTKLIQHTTTDNYRWPQIDRAMITVDTIPVDQNQTHPNKTKEHNHG